MLCAANFSAYGQEKPGQPKKLAYGADLANVPEAMAKVKSGNFVAVDVDLIARAGAICACSRRAAESKDCLRLSGMAANMT